LGDEQYQQYQQSAFAKLFGTIPTTLKTIVINGGTSIGSYAFYNCTSITSVSIPSSVTSIVANAFTGCSSLTSVTFENTSGWGAHVSMDKYYETTFTSSDLSNKSTAATYLASTYDNWFWTCTV